MSACDNNLDYCVAIALATYNGAQYLEDQLNSIIHQSFGNWRCYIHDDGSQDGTVSILKKYIEMMPDRFILLDYEPVHSASKNFLSILKYIEEPYVMFSDQDDVWIENKIEIEISEIQRIEKTSNDIPILVFTDMRVVNQHLEQIDKSFFHYTSLNPQNAVFNRLIIENFIPGCTTIMNKKAYDLVRKCPDPNKVVMHDMWCGLVVSSCGLISYVNESTSFYRQHCNNVQGTKKHRTKGQIIIKYVKQLFNHKSLVKEKNRLYQKLDQVSMMSHYNINKKAYDLLKRIQKINDMSFFNRYYVFRNDLCLGIARSIEYAFFVK